MANTRLAALLAFVGSSLLLFIYVQNFNFPYYKINNSKIQNKSFGFFRNISKQSSPVLSYNVTVNILGKFCNRTVFPRHLLQTNKWLPVDELMSVFVFSAYYVMEKGAVYVIGARLRSVHEVVCQLWYHYADYSAVYATETKAKLAAPEEGFPNESPYTSTIVECSVVNATMPNYVSIVKASCGLLLNLLVVNNATAPGQYKFNFTVCLSPLFNTGQANEVVEWIELNRILGADKFVVYDHSSAENVKNVLKYYSELGIIDVVKWRPEMRVNETHFKSIPVHYHAQTASLNDCLYRSKSVSKFVVNVDLDEVIIPHLKHATTWTDMLSVLERNKAAYIFRSTFFVREWENKTFLTNRTLVPELNLLTLRLFEHESRIFPHPVRTKYIARTKDVYCALIHEPLTRDLLRIDSDVTIVHHYRSIDNSKETRVKDFTVKKKYGEKLMKRVAEVWSHLPGVKMESDAVL